MNQDYAVRAYIAWNLDDAREELAGIIEMFRPESEIDEDEFTVRMAHLYKHLNTAWNIRNVTGDDLDSADGVRLDSWGRFPTDIKPL
jgi:hypothetical protein